MSRPRRSHRLHGGSTGWSGAWLLLWLLAGASLSLRLAVGQPAGFGAPAASLTSEEWYQRRLFIEVPGGLDPSLCDCDGPSPPPPLPPPNRYGTTGIPPTTLSRSQSRYAPAHAGPKQGDSCLVFQAARPPAMSFPLMSGRSTQPSAACG